MTTNPNTQLPAEVVKQIDSDANDYLGLKEVEFSQRSFNAYVAGATAYAAKLHQLQQENGRLLQLFERILNHANNADSKSIDHITPIKRLAKQGIEILNPDNKILYG
jgi:hypothetical protein